MDSIIKEIEIICGRLQLATRRELRLIRVFIDTLLDADKV